MIIDHTICLCAPISSKLLWEKNVQTYTSTRNLYVYCVCRSTYPTPAVNYATQTIIAALKLCRLRISFFSERNFRNRNRPTSSNNLLMPSKN